jgi:hypothetical protein
VGERGLAVGGGAPDQGHGERRHPRGLADDAVPRSLAERQRGHEPDPEPARDVGEEERHAGHVDRRDGPDPGVGEVPVEHRAPSALGRQAQDRLAPEALGQGRPLAPPAPRAHPGKGLVEEMPLLEAPRGVLPISKRTDAS